MTHPAESVCRWCRCAGFHAEDCEGFEINDPAAKIAARSAESVAVERPFAEDYECTCGPWCDPWRDDGDGIYECSFCGADWGYTAVYSTGWLEPWHQEWCVHGSAGKRHSDGGDDA